MAVRKIATMTEVHGFDEAGKLKITPKEISERVGRGERLEYEESQFSDPGPDYTALYFGQDQVGYWEGY